jgi:hypothetical protein
MGSHWVLTLLYLKNVPCWPEDDRLGSKRVAIMWPDCIYNITVLIYFYVLAEYNTLYKFVTTQRDGLCKKGTLGTSWCDIKYPWILIHIYVYVFSMISDYKHYFLKHYLLMYVYSSYTLSTLCGRKFILYVAHWDGRQFIID